MQMSLQAANPRINATVTASAGSGKTYMLITRILRLLLDGAEPGSILALTFTRKAAAEMQQRLAERLYELATVDDDRLLQLLQALELDASYSDRARRLYEAHQYCDYPVRSLTFHAFCQDLLSRFPLEADIPPNFDLLESAELLIQQARDALFNEAALDMQGSLSSHLQQLMQLCGGLHNLHRVLSSFLQQRSDWWAYTDGKADVLDFAQQQLASNLGYQADIDPLQQFFSTRMQQDLQQFALLLGEEQGKKNLQAADTIASWLVHKTIEPAAFEQLRGCFLTQKNEPLSQGRKDTKALRKRLGDDRAEQFLELHLHISSAILDTLDQLNKQHCYELNRHWYYCGIKFIEHYQTLKRQQRILDFTDLEWRSYKLLQDSDNALWIQYKLDQQIQHLLIDEFQDTNPTQWQLILPLLEEIAAAESESARSVFLVGDEKQSIYSFRRAKPELQQQAADWLAEHLDAQNFPLNKSWRSSPAIMHTVNAVFEQEQFRATLPTFKPHETHHQDLPGRVEVLPLWHNNDVNDEETPVYCRDPLLQPRSESPSIHQYEARQIAQHIQQLVNQRTAVIDNGQRRALNFNDIFILVRKRAHVAEFERALRDAGIAYLGTNRGTFLDCLEIQDMEALINTLLTPFNNLALAQVLKSPIFCATDDHLQLIAAHKGPAQWYERLQNLSDQLEPQHPLNRAWHLLSEWRQLTDKIPVHDLLDRIFADTDLLERYQRATPPALQPRVNANLTLFMEMALDLDSGRYPSLMHFLYYLRSLRQTSGDAPDEAPMQTREPRVKIMTIHASKGLEAPVVYLVDSIVADKDRSAMSALVNWPVEQPRPQHFQLIPASQQQDSVSRTLREQQKQSQQKEDANLLYVALTRARQYLFVSGCQGERGPFLDWYYPLQQALQKLSGKDEPHLVYSTGDQSGATESSDMSAQTDVPSIQVPPALQQKIGIQANQPGMLSPSQADLRKPPPETPHDDHDADAQQRGIAIHFCLDALTRSRPLSETQLRKQLQYAFSTSQPGLLDEWIGIATKVIQHEDLQAVFKPEGLLKFYNECPIQYTLDNQPVYGIIDRLLVSDERVLIVDYKTHQQATTENMATLAADYQQQMQLYASGVKQLWPDKTIEACLLFTECCALQPVNVS